MKINDTALIVGALAVAAGLVFMPRRAAAARATTAGLVDYTRTPGGTVWDDAAQAQFREQLRREMSGPGWENL